MPSIAHAPQGSPYYRQVVADARSALTINDIASVTGVQPRSVQNWASGAAKPEGEKRERLLELSYVIEQLQDVFEPEGIEIWLNRPQRALGHQAPMAALRLGQFREVLALVERLAGGPKH